MAVLDIQSHLLLHSDFEVSLDFKESLSQKSKQNNESELRRNFILFKGQAPRGLCTESSVLTFLSSNKHVLSACEAACVVQGYSKSKACGLEADKGRNRTIRGLPVDSQAHG